MRVVLASNSPRRKELLRLYRLPFEVIPSNADESGACGSCGEMVAQLAARKGRDVAGRCPDALVIAADTLVCLGDHILGKPKDAEDAFRMLSLLSGNRHEVHSGLYLRTPDGREFIGEDCTRVYFLPMNPGWIREYIATGEPMDKAGAYAIQGAASVFIDRIEGNPYTVVGLPMNLLSTFLQKAGYAGLPLLQE